MWPRDRQVIRRWASHQGRQLAPLAQQLEADPSRALTSAPRPAQTDPAAAQREDSHSSTSGRGRRTAAVPRSADDRLFFNRFHQQVISPLQLAQVAAP